MNSKFSFLIAVSIAFLITFSFNSLGTINEKNYSKQKNDSLDAEVSTNFSGFDHKKFNLELESGRNDFIGIDSRTGVYVNDYNRDGIEDLLVIKSGKPNLLKNTGGNFTKVDIGDYSRINYAHFFDFDNSGYPDLLLLKKGSEPILLENNKGNLEQISAGFEDKLVSPKAADTADYNIDGCLDLVIVQKDASRGVYPFGYKHAKELYEKHPKVRPESRIGDKNFLYEGNCEEFKRKEKSVLEKNSASSLAVSFADLTGNGFPDIHVANDFDTDGLYLNRKGKFEMKDIGPASDRNGMSSNIADINQDGLYDIFVTNIYLPEDYRQKRKEMLINNNVVFPLGNNLFINKDEGDFEDKAEEYGVKAGGWGWGSSIEDFNNDGRLDIVHATMDVHPIWKERNRRFKEYENKMVWMGTKNGFQRLNATKLGLKKENSRGIASIDYNLDGSLDIVSTDVPSNIHNDDSDTGSAIYKNHGESDNYLQILPDSEGGVRIGAEINVVTGKRKITREYGSKSDYNSQGSPVEHFGISDNEISYVSVKWPSGNKKRYNLNKNSRYRLYRNGSYEKIF